MRILFSTRPAFEPRQVTAEAVASLSAQAMTESRLPARAVRDEIAAMPHPREVLADLVGLFG